MIPKIETDIRFGGHTLTVWFFTNKASAIQARYASIEQATPMLMRFGYYVGQVTRVVLFGRGYIHALRIAPWKKGVAPAMIYGRHGIRISTIVVMPTDPPRISTLVGKDLWYTPPIDVKQQLPASREETFAFPGRSDGSIDFNVYGQATGEGFFTRVRQRGTTITIGG